MCACLPFHAQVTNQSGSKSNQTEVQVCHQVVAALLAAGVQPKDIGVVAPYVAQVRLCTHMHAFHSSIRRSGRVRYAVCYAYARFRLGNDVLV